MSAFTHVLTHSSKGRQQALKVHDALSLTNRSRSQYSNKSRIDVKTTTRRSVRVASHWSQHATVTNSKVSSVKLGSLPQGTLQETTSSEMEALEPELSYPTVIQQAKDHMQKYAGCVLITRVGNFYELYFEQAQYWGGQLGLKVAYRRTNKRMNVKPVPMAGFPFFQLDRYLKMFVQDYGQKVAIAEEVANDPNQRVKSGGLLFDRQVQRIITPGTLIDENFLSPVSHNYLLSVHVPDMYGSCGDLSEKQMSSANPKTPVGLAWIDLSSGDFYTQTADVATLSSAIARVGPREIILDSRLQGTTNVLLTPVIAECGQRATYSVVEHATTLQNKDIMARYPSYDMSALTECTHEEVSSVSTLLSYVRQQLPGLHMRHLRLTKYKTTEHMSIDKHSLRGLEILQTMRDSASVGSLLHAVQRTSTWSGARLLAERLKAPSTSILEVNERLDFCQAFLENKSLLADVKSLLRHTTDSFRILQSVACGKGDADSLLSLSRTITVMTQIADCLKRLQSSGRSNALIKLNDLLQLEGPRALSERILAAIDESGLLAQHRQEEEDAAQAASLTRQAILAQSSGDMAALNRRLNSKKFVKTNRSPAQNVTGHDDIWIMRRNASQTLTSLHAVLDDLYAAKIRLETSLRADHGAASLTLRMTPGLGYIVHVTGKDTRSSLSTLEHARTVSSSKSTRSFYLSEWTILGKQLDEVRLRIRAEEQEIFKQLRDAVCNEVVALRKNASVIDELDVACSSASLAQERQLVRPEVNEGTSMTIMGGRHMTVEAGLNALGRSFTPNDCLLGLRTSPCGVDGAERIQLITGPNMAGKSTYLRQTALLAVMAQTGLYVPASHAALGIVDAVFSRVGAADDLFNDQSTFMVEMVETAAIIKGATQRSLVIMDEVGRGTTPEDGTALSFAVLDSLRRREVGRVLFATHFHRLADSDMCAGWDEVGCWSTKVVDEQLPDGSAGFRFVHKMARGVNRASHALKVARLAGLPEDTIEAAQRMLLDKM